MIAQETIKKLVEEGLSTYKIADALSCSQCNVRHYLKKYKLKTLRSLNQNTVLYKCRFCGEEDQANFYRRKNKIISGNQCISCGNKINAERNRKTKLLCIEYKGGKCQKCGYNKCPAALAFHHRNPKEKDLKWKNLKNMKFDKIKPELDKCDLVCNNCHAEVHWELEKS